jgi:hypothetical protein
MSVNTGKNIRSIIHLHDLPDSRQNALENHPEWIQELKDRIAIEKALRIIEKVPREGTPKKGGDQP